MASDLTQHPISTIDLTSFLLIFSYLHSYQLQSFLSFVMKLFIILLGILGVVASTPIPADTDLRATSISNSFTTIVPAGPGNVQKQINYKDEEQPSFRVGAKEPNAYIYEKTKGYLAEKIVPRDDVHGSNIRLG